MKQPEEPNKEDCCNSGCSPCIFEVYEKQLRLYKNFQECGEILDQKENGISQLEYTTFTVINVNSLCDFHKIITFKKLNKEKNEIQKIWWNPGDHFLLKYCFDTGSCTRAYTPIKMTPHSQEFDFSIIVKQYHTGLVSKYLHSLKEGDQTLWRGPFGSYEIIPNKYTRLIMLAQGTGITPFISIIDKILNNEDDFTKIVLFYCCSSEDKILLRNELYTYKSFWNFTYKIFLNSLSKNGAHKYHEPVHNQKLKYDDLLVLKPFTINDQFLLCGSKLFINEYKCFLQNENVLHENIVSF
ncbi:unnamed protein product [Parnassius mnemosyne]|uniref:NADH-cytochrome b5 reductase n=1 Tax=Parnassius mnemosyne TaxID=213953 RepID=A0AAV1MA19_9NEOP